MRSDQALGHGGFEVIERATRDDIAKRRGGGVRAAPRKTHGVTVGASAVGDRGSSRRGLVVKRGPVERRSSQIEARNRKARARSEGLPSSGRAY
jgi:hypothetical protein